jgi:lysophospholipase L1-like esterase
MRLTESIAVVKHLHKIPIIPDTTGGAHVRLVFFGDSLTWGGYGGDYVAEVARLMPDDEIINAGRGGDTVVNLLRRVDDAVLGRKPDGVFVMVGGNDAISYSQPATRGYYRWTNGAPPDGRMSVDLFTRSYRDLLTHLMLAHVQVWVGLEPLEYSPTTVAAMREFNTHAAEIARSLGVPALDLMAAFAPAHIPERPPLSQETINLIGKRSSEGWSDYETERAAGGFTYSFDGIHLTPETAQRMAAMIVAFIRA